MFGIHFAELNLSDFFPDVLRFFDVAGVLISGILGGLVAREKHFDIIGFFAVSVMAALGGGMLRDVLLQHGTPIALTDPYYLGCALTGAIISFSVRLTGKWWNRAFIVADALVIGAWSATGALKALSFDLGVLPALILGVITAVGGGAIRDVAVGNVPAVFGGNTLYATAALCGSITAVSLWFAGYPTMATFAATLVGGGLTCAARWFKWRLPLHNTFFVSDTYGKLREKMRTPREKMTDDAHVNERPKNFRTRPSARADRHFSLRQSKKRNQPTPPRAQN